MDHLKYEWKHPLFSVITSSLVKLLKLVLPISQNRAILLVVALIAAVNIVFAYIILREFIVGPLLAVWFGGIYAFLFSNLVIFSVPETYSTSNLAILTYLFVFLRKRNRLVRRDVITLGALAGMASLFNPSLISLLVIHTLYSYRLSGFKEAVRTGGISLLVAGLIFLLPNMLLEPIIDKRGFITHSQQYAARYASFEHFLEWRDVAITLLSFLWYSITMPIEELVLPSVVHFAGYFKAPEKIIFLAVYTGFMLYLFVQAAQEKNPLVIAISTWIGVLILFYLYIHPPGTILYSPEILFPLTVIIAQGFAKVTPKLGLKYYILGIGSLYLMVHNVRVLYSGTQA